MTAPVVQTGAAGGGPAAQTGGPAAGGATLSVTGGRLRTVLARGLVVRLTGAPAGAHAVTVTSAGRRVGAGRVTVSAAGSGRATVKVTKAARRALQRKRTVKLVVSAAGQRQTVTLKR
jgi:hypothetical protein